MTAMALDARRWRLILLATAALAAAAALAIRLWLAWVGPLPGDQWAVHHLETMRLPSWLGDLGVLFSVLGTPAVAIPCVVLGMLQAARAAGLRGMLFVAAASLGVVVNIGLKHLSGPTPLMVSERASHALNFPSGHTVYATTFLGALAVLAWSARRWDLVAIGGGLAALMGPFRVVAETHFVSDVIAGYLVGLGWLSLCAAVVLLPRPGLHQSPVS